VVQAAAIHVAESIILNEAKPVGKKFDGSPMSLKKLSSSHITNGSV
jgi:hypothetical protein